MADSRSIDLTGHWEGLFSYPRLMPPNGFEAELRETSGHIDGETTERSDWRRNRGSTVIALLSGHRDGHAVSFIKRYDDIQRVEPVHYEGTLSADGDEITGTWRISGQWSGSFIMVRRTRPGAVAERKTAETVR